MAGSNQPTGIYISPAIHEMAQGGLEQFKALLDLHGPVIWGDNNERLVNKPLTHTTASGENITIDYYPLNENGIKAKKNSTDEHFLHYNLLALYNTLALSRYLALELEGNKANVASLVWNYTSQFKTLANTAKYIKSNNDARQHLIDNPEQATNAQKALLIDFNLNIMALIDQFLERMEEANPLETIKSLPGQALISTAIGFFVKTDLLFTEAKDFKIFTLTQAVEFATNPAQGYVPPENLTSPLAKIGKVLQEREAALQSTINPNYLIGLLCACGIPQALTSLEHKVSMYIPILNTFQQAGFSLDPSNDDQTLGLCALYLSLMQDPNPENDQAKAILASQTDGLALLVMGYEEAQCAWEEAQGLPDPLRLTNSTCLSTNLVRHEAQALARQDLMSRHIHTRFDLLTPTARLGTNFDTIRETFKSQKLEIQQAQLPVPKFEDANQQKVYEHLHEKKSQLFEDIVKPALLAAVDAKIADVCALEERYHAWQSDSDNQIAAFLTTLPSVANNDFPTLPEEAPQNAYTIGQTILECEALASKVETTQAHLTRLTEKITEHNPIEITPSDNEAEKALQVMILESAQQRCLDHIQTSIQKHTKWLTSLEEHKASLETLRAEQTDTPESLEAELMGMKIELQGLQEDLDTNAAHTETLNAERAKLVQSQSVEHAELKQVQSHYQPLVEKVQAKLEAVRSEKRRFSQVIAAQLEKINRITVLKTKIETALQDNTQPHPSLAEITELLNFGRGKKIYANAQKILGRIQSGPKALRLNQYTQFEQKPIIRALNHLKGEVTRLQTEHDGALSETVNTLNAQLHAHAAELNAASQALREQTSVHEDALSTFDRELEALQRERVQLLARQTDLPALIETTTENLENVRAEAADLADLAAQQALENKCGTLAQRIQTLIDTLSPALDTLQVAVTNANDISATWDFTSNDNDAQMAKIESDQALLDTLQVSLESEGNLIRHQLQAFNALDLTNPTNSLRETINAFNELQTRAVGLLTPAKQLANEKADMLTQARRGQELTQQLQQLLHDTIEHSKNYLETRGHELGAVHYVSVLLYCVIALLNIPFYLFVRFSYTPEQWEQQRVLLDELQPKLDEALDNGDKTKFLNVLESTFEMFQDTTDSKLQEMVLNPLNNAIKALRNFDVPEEAAMEARVSPPSIVTTCH